MEEKKESIGTRFRIVRKSKGMNQCDFANLLGISQAYLSSIETGRRKPKLEVVQSLADLGLIDFPSNGSWKELMHRPRKSSGKHLAHSAAAMSNSLRLPQMKWMTRKSTSLRNGFHYT